MGLCDTCPSARSLRLGEPIAEVRGQHLGFLLGEDVLGEAVGDLERFHGLGGTLPELITTPIRIGHGQLTDDLLEAGEHDLAAAVVVPLDDFSLVRGVLGHARLVGLWSPLVKPCAAQIGAKRGRFGVACHAGIGPLA